jgi:hypothetical protein
MSGFDASRWVQTAEFAAILDAEGWPSHILRAVTDTGEVA